MTVERMRELLGAEAAGMSDADLLRLQARMDDYLRCIFSAYDNEVKQGRRWTPTAESAAALEEARRGA